MVPLTDLWLAIVISAVLVFVASSVIHMVLKYHQSEYNKLPDEAKLLDAMRAAGVSPGTYAFPRAANYKDMSSPEMIEKYNQGPVGMMTETHSGPPAMGKYLVQWFIYCLVIGVFAAYLAGRTLSPGEDYLQVFRVTGAAAFLGYAGAIAQDAIWTGQSWSATIKSTFDGLVYGLLTAGVFGWLWPQ
ncbi:MAG: hypothetical protein P8Y29_10385 [Gemmatimonadota bacterium]